MNRRTFMQAAAASTASVGIAGCLSDETEPTPELGADGPPEYDLPPWSELTPAETHTGNGVVVGHLRLAVVAAVRQARDDRELTAEPAIELPLSGISPILTAVETLSTYPFAAPLHRAVNDAAGSTGDAGSTNEPLVEPANGTVETNRTTGTTRPVTENESVAETSGERERFDNGSENSSLTNGSVENETTNATAENTTVETPTEGEPDVGIEVDGITLADDVLVFQGEFDQSVFERRYATGFQQVDEHRELTVYENGSGLGFAVGDGLLVVPTERDSRAASATTVLAHTLSGYVTTLDRIVDEEAGQWLFETTGPAAFSLGVWGADEPLERIEAVGTTLDSDPGFEAIEGFIAALEPTVDESETVTAVETRFAGVFSSEPPTDDEFQSALVGDRETGEIYRDGPRAHLLASFGDN